MKKVHVFRFLIAAVLFVFTVVPCMAQQADKPVATEQPVQPAKPAKAAKAKSEKSAVTGKININTATAEQLDMLPGIGPAKSKALIDYRTKNGNFKNIEDLQKVPGIKQKKIDKLKEYIIFEGETTLKAEAAPKAAK